MPTLLALLAAFAFGAGDFLGGLAARRAPALATAFVTQTTGLVLLVAVLPWVLSGELDGHTIAWGAAAGFTGGIAALSLYPALALGVASEVAPLSAVIGTALPILFGILQGERPGAVAWLGIALALVTIVLVTAGGAQPTGTLDAQRRRRSLVLAAVSGVFIGLFLICFERAGSAQGLLPLLVARLTSVPLLALALLLSRMRPWPARVSLKPALLSGTFDITANTCYLLALAGAPLSITATLTNLYPAFTVLLGVMILGERPLRMQKVGLLLALVAIVLITR